MSNLHIAVAGADEETKRRALEALDAAGIEVYRAWIEETGPVAWRGRRPGSPLPQ